METTMTAGTKEPPEGRLSRLADREEDNLATCYAEFKKAWAASDAPRALVAFAWFREALDRHMKWEEESLFEEYEARCTVPELKAVHRHHLEHEAIRALTGRIQRAMETRMGWATPREDELGFDLTQLDALVHEHRRLEHDQICRPLDAWLTEPQVLEIETELAERGCI